MHLSILIILLVGIKSCFPFIIEVKSVPENMQETGAVPYSFSDNNWMKTLFLKNIVAEMKGLRPSWDQSTGFWIPRENEKVATISKQEDDTHFPPDVRQGGKIFPLEMLNSWARTGTKLLKKTSAPPEGKSDDSVPFWAARG